MNAITVIESRARTRRDERTKHRSVRERLVITGKLVLETPASFGNGDADAFTDMPLLEDEVDGAPLLPGTSIAGAIRNYLRERELGFEVARGKAEATLFGGYSGADDGWQSPLIVHDARGATTEYELRDGVKIDLRTRTAADDKKYDYRLLAAGATFDLRFELLIGQPPGEDFATHRRQLLQALVTALGGLAQGEITLGACKRRGFGRCKVERWEVRSYDLTQHAGLLAWLAESRENAADWTAPVTPIAWAKFVEVLGENAQPIQDQRRQLSLSATFSVDGSVMVRSGFGESDQGADMVHLHSFREDQNHRRPIIAGKSWAGALRSRATQIVNTLGTERVNKQGHELIERVFGPEVIDKQRDIQTRQPARASRIVVAESVISDGRPLRQSRVKIDRFTGGAFESALFDEEPLYGLPETKVKLDISLRTPGSAGGELSDEEQKQGQAEVGLLLLLLKDLWTGDLAVGGEIGVGRGRFAGREATLNWNGQEWQFRDGSLVVTGDKDALEECTKALKEVLNRG